MPDFNKQGLFRTSAYHLEENNNHVLHFYVFLVDKTALSEKPVMGRIYEYQFEYSGPKRRSYGPIAPDILLSEKEAYEKIRRLEHEMFCGYPVDANQNPYHDLLATEYEFFFLATAFDDYKLSDDAAPAEPEIQHPASPPPMPLPKYPHRLKFKPPGKK